MTLDGGLHRRRRLLERDGRDRASVLPLRCDEIVGERRAVERPAKRRDAVLHLDVYVCSGDVGLAERVTPDSLGDRLVVDRNSRTAEEATAERADAVAALATLRDEEEAVA